MILCPRIDSECQLCSTTEFGEVCGGSLLRYVNPRTKTLLVSGIPENISCRMQLSARERQKVRKPKRLDLDYSDQN